MSPARVGPASGVLADYLRRSRSATYGLLLALPLLVAYETLAAAMNAGEALHLRNAADVVLRRGLALLGARTTLAATALLVAAGVLLVLRERRRDPTPLVGRYFAWMLGESAVLALLFGSVVGSLTRLVLAPLAGGAAPLAGAVALATGAAPGLGAQLVLSLGAGLYEELLFRVLLIPALALALRAAGMERAPASAAAALLSALAFSAAHYIGPMGDPFALGSFVFRFLGGLAFAAILVLRGFGIAAWTHALYDVFLTLGGA